MGSTEMPSFEVAIVGGGLCGLSVAIALKNRSIPFTVYEARSSFTELGHGINIGPNALEAFRLIDSSLGEAIYKLCTRNAPGKEDVWFQIRFGAPSGKHHDGELIMELMSPPTGNMTVIRNELLQLLAEMAGLERARFNKKLVELSQDSSGVTLHFADSTQAHATVLIASDGIHSAARRAVLGASNPATEALYSGMGAYRAVVPMSVLSSSIGHEQARTSQIYLGPGAYVIMYPIERGKKVNVGFWPWRREPWHLREWTLPGQRIEMERDFAKWGATVHKIMNVMGDPSFFATHHHTVQPESLVEGRVCLIGDAAHSMPPHQGAGAGQAMEDAYVIAELLSKVDRQKPIQRQIDAAFKGYEAVRKQRSAKVAETSQEAMDWWTGFYNEDVSDEKIEQFTREADEKFRWIWHDDIAGQARSAIKIMEQLLEL